MPLPPHPCRAPLLVVALGASGCALALAGTGVFDNLPGPQPQGDENPVLLGVLALALAVGLLTHRSFAMAAAAAIVLLVASLLTVADLAGALSTVSRTHAHLHTGWAIALAASAAGELPVLRLVQALARTRTWL
ncbi:MAG: hypothetical protein LC118_07510 [Dehalococcoidia bacterium]|nr:hypothetical protein [Dehalococcoidia bacterium]